MVKSKIHWKEEWDRRANSNADPYVLATGRLDDLRIIEYLNRRVSEMIKTKDSDIIVDIGCGPGEYAVRYAPKVKEYICIDFSPKMIRLAKKRLEDETNTHFIIGSADALPLKDSVVNKAMCMDMTHYLSDEEVRKTVLEMHRVVEDGGVLVFQLKNTVSFFGFFQRIKQLIGSKERYRSYMWYFKLFRDIGDISSSFAFGIQPPLLNKLFPKLSQNIRVLEVKIRKRFPWLIPRHFGADLFVEVNNRCTSLKESNEGSGKK